MSTDRSQGVSVPPTPFPNPLVFVWLAVLEGIVAGALVVFSISMVEGGQLVPDVLAEWGVGLGVFVLVTVGMTVYRFYVAGYVGS